MVTAQASEPWAVSSASVSLEELKEGEDQVPAQPPGPSDSSLLHRTEAVARASLWLEEEVESYQLVGQPHLRDLNSHCPLGH